MPIRASPGVHAYAWGAYDVERRQPGHGTCVPLDLKKTYKVGTNEFLAPAGGDDFSGFKYMKNITYWGDMLDAVNAYVSKNYTHAHPYKGPVGDGTLDGRITQDGDRRRAAASCRSRSCTTTTPTGTCSGAYVGTPSWPP